MSKGELIFLAMGGSVLSILAVAMVLYIAVSLVITGFARVDDARRTLTP